MKWFEYKREVDDLRAPDALKARLMDMAPEAAPGADQASAASAAGAAQAGPAKTEETAAPQPRPVYTAPQAKAAPARSRFWQAAQRRRIGPLAAAFALGVVCCGGIAGANLGWFARSESYGTELTAMSTAAYASAEADNTADLASGADTAKAGLSLMTKGSTASGDAAAAGNGTDASGSSEVPDIGSDNAQVTGRKIIYTANLTLETKDYDGTLGTLADAVAAANGYEASRQEYSYGESQRSISCVYRIPADAYESFLAAAAGSGSVTNRTESASDVTADYIDVSARVKALTTQRDRLLELEAQADTLENLIAIEDKLTEVQYELESYQSQLNYYDDQVEYCTVTIDVQEVSSYTPVQPTFWEKVSSAFQNGWSGFVSVWESLLLWLVRSWLWLVILAAAVWAGRRIWKKKHAA